MLESVVGLLMRLKMPRPVAAFLACSFSLLAVYLAGLGLWVQLIALSDELPRSSARVTPLTEVIDERIGRFGERLFRFVVPRWPRQRRAHLE